MFSSKRQASSVSKRKDGSSNSFNALVAPRHAADYDVGEVARELFERTAQGLTSPGVTVGVGRHDHGDRDGSRRFVNVLGNDASGMLEQPAMRTAGKDAPWRVLNANPLPYLRSDGTRNAL